MNFKDFFDISSYEVQDEIMDGDFVVNGYGVNIKNNKISETEYIHIDFETFENGISILNMTTWSEFDRKHPKKPCAICGSTNMDKEAEDENGGTLYSHVCDLDEEDVKACLREILNSEYLENYLDEQEFNKLFTVIIKSNKSNYFYFTHEWVGNRYEISKGNVYHTSLIKDEIDCLFCCCSEEIRYEYASGLYLQKCSVLTHHVDKLVSIIKNASSFTTSLSDKEHLKNYIIPGGILQRTLSNLLSNSDREKNLFRAIKQELKGEIKLPIQEHIFTIKEDENKVSISLDGVVFNPTSLEYDTKFYDDVIVMKLSKEGVITKYLNEVMLKHIRKSGFLISRNDQELKEAIEKAEQRFNSLVY